MCNKELKHNTVIVVLPCCTQRYKFVKTRVRNELARIPIWTTEKTSKSPPEDEALPLGDNMGGSKEDKDVDLDISE